jgi:hypothetical protein
MTERYVHENLQVLQPSAVALDKFYIVAENYDNSTTVNKVDNLPKAEKLFKIN